MDESVRFASKLKVGVKIWLEVDQQQVFGGGLFQLIQRINEAGSLKEAAASLGMSYRYAWEKIRKAEKRLGHALVHRRVGGTQGGSSQLTSEGHAFLEVFGQLQKDVEQYAMARLKALTGGR